MAYRNGGKFLFLGVSMILVLGLMLGGDSTNKTTDDSSNLSDILRSNLGKGVLGADSNDEDSICPEAKPVIGWIDFSGNKLIVDDVPNGENPSNCYTTEEEANADGFYKE